MPSTETKTNGGDPDVCSCGSPLYAEESCQRGLCRSCWMQASMVQVIDDWQPAPEGLPYPPGCEFTLDMSTGQRMVRWDRKGGAS